MPNMLRTITVVLVLAAVVVGRATSAPQPEQFDPQSLVGEWSGEWRSTHWPAIVGQLHYTIQAVYQTRDGYRVDGKAWWTKHVGGSDTAPLRCRLAHRRIT